jgi:hypothetical protein
MANRFFTPRRIEELANEVLALYELRSRKNVALPISSEELIDGALHDQLNTPLWYPIDEPPGRTILAGLAPQDRLIVLNEGRRQLLTENEGLLNTTIAHEIGHWVLHVDQALIDHPALPGFKPALSYTCERSNQLSWDEKNAHRFMGSLLMPRRLVCALAADSDLTCWSGLYELRRQLDVTISALTVRLDELGLAYVAPDGSIHRSRHEARGQQPLL